MKILVRNAKKSFKDNIENLRLLKTMSKNNR